MKRVRQRVKDETGSSRNGVKDVRELIRRLNPVLRGWGANLRAGNAAEKLNQLDGYVWRREFVKALGLKRSSHGRKSSL